MSSKNSIFFIDQLSAIDSQQVLAHLLRLSPEDRYLRFCTAASDEFIRRYVETTMVLDNNLTFGAFVRVGDRVSLIGLANIAIVNETSCELAFSIDEDLRGSGLARQLMRTAITKCEELGMSKLCMSCLRTNKKMQALASLFGLRITIDYDEAYAELGITK